YYLYACLIVFIGMLYASDMLVWGSRFSNLAYRGLIWHGPFGYVRHPAYLTKCIHFWIIAWPFFAPDKNGFWLQTVQLTFLSVLYWVRSRLEDRHLRAQPEYRMYEQRVHARYVLGSQITNTKLAQGQ